MARLIFDHILTELTERALHDEDTNYTRCENMNTFVRLLVKGVKSKYPSEETVYIVSCT